MRLVTVGRRTGLPHIVEVRFVKVNNSFLVLGGNGRSNWVRNALAQGKARARIGQWSYDCSVRIALEPTNVDIIRLFEKKYGGRIIKQWYSEATVPLEVFPLSSPNLRGAPRGEFETTQDFSEWQKHKGSNYYSAVSEAFD